MTTQLSSDSPATERPGQVGRDRLTVAGLEIFAHHGVFDFERAEGQTFIVDLTLEVDTARAAASDDLADTVDYGTLVDQVVEAVAKDPVNLIETVAQRIAEICLSHAGVHLCDVTVHKPQAPITTTFKDVALTITRRRV